MSVKAGCCELIPFLTQIVKFGPNSTILADTHDRPLKFGIDILEFALCRLARLCQSSQKFGAPAFVLTKSASVNPAGSMMVSLKPCASLLKTAGGAKSLLRKVRWPALSLSSELTVNVLPTKCLPAAANTLL